MLLYENARICQLRLRLSNASRRVVFFNFEIRDLYLLEELAGGRPQKLLKEGVSEKTLGRRYKELDALIDVKSGMHFLNEIAIYVAVDDKELLDRWHRARLNETDETTLEIGENTIGLIQSYPETSTARTSLMKSTSKGTFTIYKFTLSIRYSKHALCQSDWSDSSSYLQCQER